MTLCACEAAYLLFLLRVLKLVLWVGDAVRLATRKKEESENVRCCELLLCCGTVISPPPPPLPPPAADQEIRP
jgi:hypothetical protein